MCICIYIYTQNNLEAPFHSDRKRHDSNIRRGRAAGSLRTGCMNFSIRCENTILGFRIQGAGYPKP